MKNLLRVSSALGLTLWALSPYNPILLIESKYWLWIIVLSLLFSIVGLYVLLRKSEKEVTRLRENLNASQARERLALAEQEKFKNFHETFQEKVARERFRNLGIEIYETSDDRNESRSSSERIRIQVALARASEEELDWMDSA